MTQSDTTPETTAAKADPALVHVAVEWKHTSPLICCRFDPQGRYVFATAEDNSIQRWELGTGTQLGLVGHNSWVRSLDFLPDGQTMISGGCDGQLIWWPAAGDKSEPLRKVAAHKGWIRFVAVSPDGKLVASAGNDNLVKLWNAVDGTLVREFVGHESHVYSTLFHPSGQFLLSGDLKGNVHQWDVAAGTLVRKFDAQTLYSYNGGQGVDYGGVRSLSVSADNKFLACSGLHNASNPLGAVNDPLVVVFEWESQNKLRSCVGSDVKGVAWRAQFHADGFLVAASGGSGGGFLLFWRPDADKEFHKFQLPNTARDCDLHPDGLQIATAHHDRHIRISRMTAKPTT